MGQVKPVLHRALDAAYVVSKAGEIDPVHVQAAQVIFREALGDPQKWQELLLELYGDAALQGGHAAGVALGGQSLVTLRSQQVGLPDSYWSDWQPGYGAASSKMADGGLASLLDDRGITIKNITGTTLDGLGNVISDGLANGDPFQKTATAVMDFVANPYRANMIADTEFARGMTSAALDTYSANGVEQVEWLAEGDACELCQENEDASPIGMGDDWPNGDVPVHPLCRCAIAPVIDTSEGTDE